MQWKINQLFIYSIVGGRFFQERTSISGFDYDSNMAYIYNTEYREI